MNAPPAIRQIVQVAGVLDAEDAAVIVAGGADWIGFPFGLDFHGEDLPLAAAARIVAALPPSVRPLLITYIAEPDGIIALAESLGVQNGDWVTAESRRGDCTLRALVVTTIRPDTVFIPYHWPGRKSANQLTISAQDPISKIPEYKVCAVRLRKAQEAPEYAGQLEPQQG